MICRGWRFGIHNDCFCPFPEARKSNQFEKVDPALFDSRGMDIHTTCVSCMSCAEVIPKAKGCPAERQAASGIAAGWCAGMWNLLFVFCPIAPSPALLAPSPPTSQLSNLQERLFLQLDMSATTSTLSRKQWIWETDMGPPTASEAAEGQAAGCSR